MPTPTNQDNTDELRENVEKIFIGLESNLNDPRSILGYGHAIEQVITLVLKARTEAADFGNVMREKLGWPESLKREPSRVRALQKRITELENQLKDSHAH